MSQSRRGLLAVLLIGQSMAIADTSIVNVAAPSIHDTFSATGAQLEWVVSAYILTLAVLMISGARMGELHGYRRIFRGGLALFTLASAACGLSPRIEFLVVARLIQGAGAALLVPQVLSLIQLRFSGAARARAIGLYALALSGSAVAGQVLGGLVIAANLFDATWRPAFLMNVPIGLALMVVTPHIMRDVRDDRGAGHNQLDLLGVAALSATILLVIGPLMVGREQQWPVWTWLSFAASVPALAAFVLLERRVARRGGYPLVNLTVVAQPAVGWGLLAYGAAGATAFGMFLIIALYLQQGLGKSPLFSGLVTAAWLAAFSLAVPVLRRLPAAYGAVLAPFGSVGMAAAFAGMSLMALASGGPELLLIGLMAAAGFGFGLCRIALTTHLTNSVHESLAADISGLINTDSYVSAAAGVAVFGTIYLGATSGAGPELTGHAFALVNAAFALTALGAAFAALRSIGNRTGAMAVDAELSGPYIVSPDARRGSRGAQAARRA